MKKFVIPIIFIIIIMNMSFINSFQNYIYASPILTSNNSNIANIGVLLYSFDDLYISKIKQSLENIQNNNENKVAFTFLDSKQNKAIQNINIDSVLNNDFDLLILNLFSPTKDELIDIVNKAKQKNIPLIIFNIDPSIIPQISKLYDKVVYIATDSKQLGTLQGKILADEWNMNRSLLDKNNNNVLEYVILQGRTDTPVPIERTQASISAIENAGIKTKQLELISAYWDKELAKNAVDSLFLKSGNKIEAIISNNDAMAIGAIEALQKYGYNKGDKSKYISVVGIDGLDVAKDLIDKGLMTGTVTQSPEIIAESLYTVGMNLISNVNPIENTNYKITDGQIIVPALYDQYVK